MHSRINIVGIPATIAGDKTFSGNVTMEGTLALTGDVGIGQATPTAPLHIKSSNVYNAGTDTAHLILEYDSGTAGGCGVLFTRTGQSTQWGIEAETSGGSQFFTIDAGGNSRLKINATTGYTGILKDTPAAQLDIEGSITDPILMVNQKSTGLIADFQDNGATAFKVSDGGTVQVEGAAPIYYLRNTTHEDGEAGRESKVTFIGEQSGGEASTLAEIRAQHDGTSDDEKGDLIFYTNDGDDGWSPTEALRLDSAQAASFAGVIGVSGETPPSQAAHIANASGDDATEVNAILVVLENLGFIAKS